MLRIGQIEATATADKKYTDGSVAGGVAATRLRAAAFNAMQEELAHIVEEAGLTLDVNDMTQVLAGLRKLFLSRTNPFADIKSDGAAAIAAALDNIGAAPLSNPLFTGTPKAPTASAGTNTTQIATTAFVAAAINSGGLFSPSGWRRNPDGIIEQWGVGVTGTDGSATVVFPTPFSIAAYAPTALTSVSTPAPNVLNAAPPHVNRNDAVRTQSIQHRGVGIRFLLEDFRKMSNYVWSAKNNAFFYTGMVPDYIAAGWDLSDAIEIDDATVITFQGNPPDGKMLGSVDGMPAWVDKPLPPISEIYGNKVNTIRSNAEAAATQIRIPLLFEEGSTWWVQAEEAKAWSDDNTYVPVMLNEMVSSSSGGWNLPDLTAIILSNLAAWKVASGNILGQSKTLRVALDSLKDKVDLGTKTAADLNAFDCTITTPEMDIDDKY